MKKIFIMAMIAAVALSYSCKKSDIMVYDDQRYIYLNLETANTGLFSFSFISTLEKRVKLPVPLKFSGKKLADNTTYSLAVDDKTTTMKSTEYALPKNIVFNKNNFTDTLWVELIYSERMATELLTLTLNLLSNDNFMVVDGFCKATITVSGIDTKPDWWTDAVTNNYLGTYSSKKFKLFRENIFIGDFGRLSGDEKLYHTLKFRDYLKTNIIYEDETGVRMWVSNQFN